MDDATRAYLFTLGNPYAKLSILDEEEAVTGPAAAPESRPRRRTLKSGVDATQAYLFELENPYAKLSIFPPAEREEQIDLIWKTRTNVYEYVSESFALPSFGKRPPPLLKQLGEKVIRLGPRAQRALYDRIAAHLPDEQIVYNRLSPKELDRLLIKLIEMANVVAALDGKKD
jgi:hypothetical protein